MLIDSEDWATVSDSDLWHAANGGAQGAADELRRREQTRRTQGMPTEVQALMASRVRNGRPAK